MAAVKFPALDVTYSDGTNLSLPTVFNANGVDTSATTVPKASLMCLSFRASSQVREFRNNSECLFLFLVGKMLKM